MDPATVMGPNVRRLVAARAAQLQVEAAKARYGAAGFGEIASVVAEDGVTGLQGCLKGAAEWVVAALKILREAPDAGKYGWTSDEDAAGELLRQIEARKISQREGR